MSTTALPRRRRKVIHHYYNGPEGQGRLPRHARPETRPSVEGGIYMRGSAKPQLV